MSPECEPSDVEIVSERVLAVPRELVFEAFTDPARLARWWGPQGFTSRFEAFDPRPGGAWRLVMRGPDGAEYANEWEFVELARPERIVLRHLGPMHRFDLTITLADRSGRTALTWRMRLESAQEVATLGRVIAAANEENLDRLAAHVGTAPWRTGGEIGFP